MKLKSICDLRGITFGALSKETGLSVSYLYTLASNDKVNPTLDVLKKLIKALDVPIDFLIKE